MEKRVLFVADTQSFLVGVIEKGLKTAGYEVEISPPDIVHIDLIKNQPEIYIVYLEGDVVNFNGTLSYLKNKISSDDNRRLYLIGTPAEIQNAYDVVPKVLVSATFARPVNVGDIINTLNAIFSANEQGKKRILVVDDDSVLLRTMNLWFSKKYEVYMASSGMNAISLLAQKKVDLILLDYEMPVVSGLQVFEMLKSEPSTANIPVIFLTAKDDKETVMKVLSVKPEKYLLKTLPQEQLVKSVDDFFKGK